MVRDSLKNGKQRKQEEPRKAFPLTAGPTRLVIVILFASFAVYANALVNGFVYDDAFQILGNRWITDIRYLPEIFSESVWGFKSASAAVNYYRPLMHVINLAAYHVFGLKPWGFHLVSIMFHAGASILVFLIAARLFRRTSSSPSSPEEGSREALLPAFAAALLFAVHPIHTEAVDWAAGITDVAFTFFYLLSFFLYIRSGPGFSAAMVGSLLSFLAAALLKEPALTLPVLLVAYDAACGRSGFRPAATLRRVLPFLAAAGIYFVLRYRALGGFAPFREGAELGAVPYLLNVFALFSRYLEKLLLPVNLNLWHSFHPLTSWFTVKGLLSLLVAAGYAAGLFLSFKRSKVVFFCLVLIVVPLLPTFHITGIYGHPFAERYLYLPSVGYVMLAALVFNRMREQWPGGQAVVPALLLAIVGLYSLGTVGRNGVWRDEYTLFSDTVKKSPDADDPRVSLGNALSGLGRTDEAVEQFRAALAINPGHAMAHSNLGNLLLKKGRIDEAIEHYQASIKLSPAYDEAYNNLGGAYQRKGLLDLAIEHYQRAVKLNPSSAEIHYNLGLAYGEKRLLDRASEELRIAVGLRPGFVQALYDLGLVLGERGLLDQAIEQFKTALRHDPNNLRILDSLGVAYLEKGLVEEAIEHFRRAVAVDPNNAPSRYYLGKAYEKKGMGTEASEQYRMAEKLAPGNPVYDREAGPRR